MICVTRKVLHNILFRNTEKNLKNALGKFLWLVPKYFLFTWNEDSSEGRDHYKVL